MSQLGFFIANGSRFAQQMFAIFAKTVIFHAIFVHLRKRIFVHLRTTQFLCIYAHFKFCAFALNFADLRYKPIGSAKCPL